MSYSTFRKIIQYLLFLASILLLISGWGITESKIVEPLTLGILDKPASFKLHEFLVWPFIVLLVLHILNLSKFWIKKSK